MRGNQTGGVVPGQRVYHHPRAVVCELATAAGVGSMTRPAVPPTRIAAPDDDALERAASRLERCSTLAYSCPKKTLSAKRFPFRDALQVLESTGRPLQATQCLQIDEPAGVAEHVAKLRV